MGRGCLGSDSGGASRLLESILIPLAGRWSGVSRFALVLVRLGALSSLGGDSRISCAFDLRQENGNQPHPSVGSHSPDSCWLDLQHFPHRALRAARLFRRLIESRILAHNVQIDEVLFATDVHGQLAPC